MYKAIRRLDGIEGTSAGWKSDILLCNGYLPISGALMIADFTNREALKSRIERATEPGSGETPV
jgi:hypothetical protein